MPKEAILSTIDVIVLYSNIPYNEGQTSPRKILESKDNKKISSGTLIEFAGVVLKNNILEFDEKSFRKIHGTAIGIKFYLHMVFCL